MPEAISGERAKQFLHQAVIILQSYYPYRENDREKKEGSIAQKYRVLLSSNVDPAVSRGEIQKDLESLNRNYSSLYPDEDKAFINNAVLENFDLFASGKPAFLKGQAVNLFVQASKNILDEQAGQRLSSAYLEQVITPTEYRRLSPKDRFPGVHEAILSRPTLNALLHHVGYDSRHRLVEEGDKVLDLYDKLLSRSAVISSGAGATASKG